MDLCIWIVIFTCYENHLRIDYGVNLCMYVYKFLYVKYVIFSICYHFALVGLVLGLVIRGGDSSPLQSDDHPYN